MRLFHGTISHFEEIDLSKSNSAKDFGRGFYLSPDKAQSERWAMFKAIQTNGTPKVYEFEFDESSLKNGGLSVRRFDGYTEDWAEFVFANRKNLSESNIHNYDIVIGPIANDKVGAQIRNYIEGNISLEVFMERLKYMKGITFQYFFGTEKAIKHLRKL
ncbi:MAG: DUF3990 domain-containing protein [Bacteroidales bacterium]|nr:DUF3990 domain-containing protein [Bacteroidales bacterium]